MFISWMVFVTFSSLFSFSGVETSRFNIPHLDKAVHFTFYFVMAMLAFLALNRTEIQGSDSRKILWNILFFTILYGIIIEVIQHVATADRYGDFLDVIANSMGAIAGITLVRLLFLGKRPLK